MAGPGGGKLAVVGGPAMNASELSELRRLCVTALRDYMREARRTCSLLQSIDASPASPDDWISAVHHRNTENRAFERYRSAREELFRALRPASLAGRMGRPRRCA